MKKRTIKKFCKKLGLKKNIIYRLKNRSSKEYINNDIYIINKNGIWQKVGHYYLCRNDLFYYIGSKFILEEFGNKYVKK